MVFGRTNHFYTNGKIADEDRLLKEKLVRWEQDLGEGKTVKAAEGKTFIASKTGAKMPVLDTHIGILRIFLCLSVQMCYNMLCFGRRCGMRIIGRKREQAELGRYFDSGRPEFIAITGRRRESYKDAARAGSMRLHREILGLHETEEERILPAHRPIFAVLAKVSRGQPN